MTVEHKPSESLHAGVEARCAEHPQAVAIGTCLRCGNFYCRECDGRRDGRGGYCARCDDSRAYVAWEDPTLGFWDRYSRTVLPTITALPKFADELPMRGGVRRPLVFALTSTMLAVVAGAGSMALFAAFMASAYSPGPKQSDLSPVALGGLLFGLFTFMALSAYALYLAVWPAVVLLVARLFGNARLTYHGAFRALCYASGLNCLLIVPLVGMLVGVYHFVVASVVIGAMTRTSPAMGFAMYGLPTLAVGASALAAYVWLMWQTVGPVL